MRVEEDTFRPRSGVYYGNAYRSAEEFVVTVTQGGVGTRGTRRDLPWANFLSPFGAGNLGDCQVRLAG